MSEHYDEKTLTQMTWDEIQKLMDDKIKDGSWKEYVKHLKKPPHIIKHDYLLQKINKQS